MRCSSTPLLLLLLLLAQACDGDPAAPRDPAEHALATSATAPAFTQVAAGANHSCALTSDNRAWCWGSNDNGQLGIGDHTSWPRTPVPVATELRFVLIRASYDFTCGLTNRRAGLLLGRERVRSTRRRHD